MKREIKFRAWSRTGEWDEFGERRVFEMIDSDSLCPNEFEPFKDSLMDINDEYYVMQFTGLKDKNGKEIYEGDILHSNKSDIYLYGNNSPVDFESGAFCVTILYDQIQEPLWGFDRVYKPTDYPNNTEKYEWIEEFEVIGNIYENPELLK